MNRNLPQSRVSLEHVSSMVSNTKSIKLVRDVVFHEDTFPAMDTRFYQKNFGSASKAKIDSHILEEPDTLEAVNPQPKPRVGGQ